MAEFADSIVNQRFKIVFNELEKTNKIKGKSDIASKLGTYNHVINSILKGERNITVEQLHKLFELYGISANFMFGFSDDIFLHGFEPIATRQQSERQYGLHGRQNIVLVANRAMAGYALAANSPQYLSDFPRFSIPNMEGNLIAFEISGNSMEPTITHGDIVVCEELERGEPIRDNQVYVVVTDVVVAKRVQQIKDASQVRAFSLISDNNFYKPYEVSPDEIQKILRVKCRLTSNAIQ
jgi:plasmid maintenance system antidote protein VapI